MNNSYIKKRDTRIKKLFEAYESRYSGIDDRVKFPIKLIEYADKYSVIDDNNKFVIEVCKTSSAYVSKFNDSNYYSKDLFVCLLISLSRYFDYKINVTDDLNTIFDVYPVLRTVTEGEL
jgi:hypothetical protein